MALKSVNANILVIVREAKLMKKGLNVLLESHGHTAECASAKEP